MQIMLCGSSDTEVFCEAFKKEVLNFEAIPLCFIDGSLYFNNYAKWDKNSIETVEQADLLVFVINEKYGKITWEVEYKRAAEIGKPFIILCTDATYTQYLKYNNEDKSLALKDKKLYDLFVRLDQEYRTVVRFQSAEFGIYLRKEIIILLKNAANALQKENKRLSLLELVKSKSEKELKKLATPENKKYLKDLLRDIFQPKEVRKRVLECFTFSNKLRLSTQEIIDLFYDTEQGVMRRTIQLLPKLIHNKIDKELVFETLVILSDESDDVGIDRRSILAMYETDLSLAVIYLQKLPMKDVGTPRRIIQWLIDNEPKVLKKLTDPNFTKNLMDLVETCIKYEEKKVKWKEEAEKVKTWVIKPL